MLQTRHVCIDFCWYMLYFSVSLYILYLSLSVRLFLITVLVTNKRMYVYPPTPSYRFQVQAGKR